MEPRKDEQPQSPGQHKEPPKKRFRLIKLEERIAPNAGGNTAGPNCCFTCKNCFHCGHISI
jgi:hypothetical protein